MESHPNASGSALIGSGGNQISRFIFVSALLIGSAALQPAHAIIAGGETALPMDSPLLRVDPLGATSPFNAIGALAISAGGFSYKGSGIALSPHWVLTAAHNLDFNDDGAPDTGLAIDFHLPGFGVFTTTAFYAHPGFTGFGNPSIQRDLGLLYLASPLPAGVSYPSLTGTLQLGSEVTLAGFGRSGYGDYGYTTPASLTDRRIGQNVIDWLTLDDLGGGFAALFRYDFDAPATTGTAGGSLGNQLETLIGPGDSGGPLLLAVGAGYSLVGVSTFIEGYGGRFGDLGGGVVLEPYLGWIADITGLAIPEPSIFSLLVLCGLLLVLGQRRRGSHGALPGERHA
jgi:hypothetical protein